MTRTTRELWANLQHPQFGGPVFPVVAQLELDATSDRELPIFVAPRNVAVRRASVAHETSPGGTAVYGLRNHTDSEDISSDIDADALAADTTSDFTLNDNADLIEEGDVIVLDYTGGSSAPGAVVVVLEIELIELK